MREVAETILFYAFAGLAVGSALSVALSRNMVRSAFGLLAALFAVAGLYALSGADFLAGIQLLIYVGGILVLILFAVMLTHRISDVKLSNATAPGPLAVLVIFVLFVVLALTVAGTSWGPPPPVPAWTTSPAPAAVDPAHAATALPHAESQTRTIGRRLVGDDLLPFEIVSVLLLAALVAAAHLARKETKDQPA